MFQTKSKQNASEIATQLNFDKMNGLLPVIIQDHFTGEILMQAFMNREAFERTLNSGVAWYFSRKRKRLWKKGEQSGHVQRIRVILTDCDNDSLLLKVEQEGGACDLGYRSCFCRELGTQGWKECGVTVFNPKQVYKYTEELQLAVPTGSLYSITMLLLKEAKIVSGKAALPVRTKYNIADGLTGILNISSADPRDIPLLVKGGDFDIGITGHDCWDESGADATFVCDLGFNKNGLGPIFWVLAVKRDSGINSLDELREKEIVTDLVRTTHRFFKGHDIPVIVSHRAKDQSKNLAVVEICESGATLAKRGYKPLQAIGTSTAVLLAHNESISHTWKRVRIESLASILQRCAGRLPPNPKRLLEVKGGRAYEPL